MSNLINLYRQAEDYFFKGIAIKCLEADEGAYAYMTGLPMSDLNVLYITKKTSGLNKALNKSKAFFEENNLTFVVVIPEAFCTPESVNTLGVLDYHQTDKTVSMALDLKDYPTNNPGYFEDGSLIRRNDNRLNEWMIPLIGAFESTFEITAMCVICHEKALKKGVGFHHFSLYKNEKPISSITLSLQDGIARIDDVSTLPEFQGQGYASRIMKYVLSEAKKLGAHYCFLESDESGVGVYQKLGFNMLFKNYLFNQRLKRYSI